MSLQTPNEEEKFSFRPGDAVVLLALLLLALAALWPILRLDAAPGLPGLDARSQWYPWRAFGFDSIRRGTLPLWNPYVLCGVPFVGNFQSALFYPPNLIFAVASATVAAKFSIVFHVWLSMVFTYLLVRVLRVGRAGATVGAVMFGLCAAQLLRVPAGHWGVSTAIPWLPLIILCTEWLIRRPAGVAVIIGAFAVAMQVLSGVPQYVFISAMAAGVFALLRGFGEGLSWKARAGRWLAVAGVFALGAAIAAIQLLPGIEAALNGARRIPMQREWVELFSLGPENLITLFVPGFFGGAEGAFYWGRFLYWEMNMYVGVVGAALAVLGLAFAKPRRLAAWFGVLALAMLLLALGRHTPLMRIVATVLPFSDMFRSSAKFLLPFSLAMAVLGGLGAHYLLTSELRGRIWACTGWMVLPVVAILLACSTLPVCQKRILATGECLYGPEEIVSSSNAVAACHSGLAALILLIGLLGGLLFFRRTRKGLAAVIVLLAAVDGVVFAWTFVGPWATFKARGSAWSAGAGEFLRRHGNNCRTFAAQTAEMNDGMLERVPTVEGIEPNPPLRFHRLFRVGQNQPADIAPSVYQITAPGPFLLRMALGNILAPDAVAPDLVKSTPVWRKGGWSILRLPAPVPRGIVVYESIVAASPDEALRLTLATDPRLAVVLEEKSVPPAVPSSASESGVQFMADTPDRVAVMVELQKPGWLVLLDNNFPGWTVEADGVPERLLQADYAFRAVALSAGRHDVVFRYRPRSFFWGFGVSMAALAGCAVGIVLSLDRRKTSRAGVIGSAGPPTAEG